MSTPRTRRQPNMWWTATVSGMASYIDSSAIISFSIVLAIYSAVYGFTPEQVGLAGGSLAFGIGVGALLGGRLGDRFGRRPVFIATMVVIIVGLLLVMFTTAFPLYITGVLLVGVGTGADLPVSLATIAEAGTDANRGRLVSLSNILWIIGVVVALVLGTAFGNLGVAAAQILLGQVVVIAFLVLLGRLTIPESDTWREARAERLAGVQTIRADRAALKELFTRRYAPAFLGLIVFYSLVNLAANTAGQYGTYMLTTFAGVDVATASSFGLIALPVLLLSYAWFMRIADKPSRFTYFTIGAILSTVGQAIPAIFGFSAITYIVSGVIGAIGAGFAFETIMKVWAQEQFPTLLRSTAQGTIIAVARFSAAGLAFVTPLLLVGGPTLLYSFLAVVSAIGFLVAYLVFRRRDRHDEFDTETALDPDVVDAAAPAATV